MRYDTVIIGGGMAGLVAGIELLKRGQRVAAVSTGQSALHFNSGSFGLMGQSESGRDVINPLQGIMAVDEHHPYGKLGFPDIQRLLPRVKPLFDEAGIELLGSADTNHYRLTPLGKFKPAWLSMKGMATTANPNDTGWGRCLIINIAGFIDFYPQFLASGLADVGLDCIVRDLSHPAIEKLRSSSTEMRATNIARVIKDDVIDQIATLVNGMARESGADTVLMPSVVGLFSQQPLNRLLSSAQCNLKMVSTMPMSVGGMRVQMSLRRLFEHLGGTYFLGDTVRKGDFDSNRLLRIYTDNLGDMPLEADTFVLASGSFVSHGLMADPQRIYEPIFDLDVDADPERSQWSDKTIFNSQNYMTYGVHTDNSFRVSRQGNKVDNLFAVGSILSASNPVKEESGAGIALLTALKVASAICNGQEVKTQKVLMSV
ncbi:MAG: anaerobic glycerol-3-phosphate dehydrogenase subunit GlpB [Muribaculum sp.]|nr:anaerobic glycerol-3-phosphate dehydrogenase subunit GlpB [Muribaculaceae bacterium]MCM1081680.1 anaerobic glycerol-3-phosphate dehydrogenase subunit GlpB [Muribaculum sp.]